MVAKPDPDTATKLAQLQFISKNVPKDETGRRALYEAARSLNFALESPGDTIHRFVHMPLQSSIAYVAGDLDLFGRIAGSSEPVSVHDLATDTGADPELLRRLLRFLASMKMVNEVGLDLFGASNITETLARPAMMASVRYGFDLITPCYQQLPKFLADTGYQNPSDGTRSALQLGHNTDQHGFIWIMSQPKMLESFHQWMTVHHEGSKVWLDEFPFEKEIAQVGSEAPLFVDIGGSTGHQCVLLKTRYPHIIGRIILQDLPLVIQQTPPLPDIEKMAYDFWTPQPVKGAKVYYMRNILHDYPNTKCAEILHNTATAMSNDSVILIDEIVLPTQNTDWHATQLDLAMMALLSSTERTELQWRALLESAGLCIDSIYRYSEQFHESIMVARPYCLIRNT